ncbi:MAG TPA: hypothetical protein VN847_26140 [Streptosporangiaceae bacterium]|nr:hypothetical protein [Streptosporangiaceae bacterium]
MTGTGGQNEASEKHDRTDDQPIRGPAEWRSLTGPFLAPPVNTIRPFGVSLARRLLPPFSLLTG